MTRFRFNFIFLLMVSALILSGCQQPQPAQPNIFIKMASAPVDGETVKELIAGGADVNARDGAGWTPLHEAARHGRVQMVEVLLEHGADAEARRGTHDWTALHYAAEEGHGEVVTALVKGGAEVETKDKHGATALHYAALFGETDVVKALVEGGANVQAQTMDGRTPRDLAKNPHIIQLLNSSM